MNVAVATIVGVKVSSLLGTISEAISLIKSVPGALDALARIKEAILNLAGKRSDNIDEDSPLGALAKSEEEAIRRLMEEFSKIQDRPDLDDYTKDIHRKRIAARLCRLFGLLEKLLKDYIKEYDKTRAVFCDFAKNA